MSESGTALTGWAGSAIIKHQKYRSEERQPGRSRGEQSNGTIAANEKRQPGRDPRRSGGSLIGAFLLAYRMKGRCDK